MKERIITAIGILAIISIVGYINNFYLMWAFIGAIYLIAIFESIKLYKLPKNIHFYTIGSIIWILELFTNGLNLTLLLGAIFLGAIAYRPNLDWKLSLPFIYPIIPFLAIFEIYKIGNVELISWLILVVALTDTMAYFVGRAVGKRGFSPTSPKKTVEGVFGGIFFGVLGGTILGNYLLEFSIIQILALSIFVSVLSIFGDLFESYLKRRANIKDSGNILPGHGGILDRVDGYMLSGIALFVILKW